MMANYYISFPCLNLIRVSLSLPITNVLFGPVFEVLIVITRHLSAVATGGLRKK